MISEIFEIMLFFGNTMNGIFLAFDSVKIGEYSLLDIFLSMEILYITFNGIFTLVSYKKNDGDDE